MLIRRRGLGIAAIAATALVATAGCAAGFNASGAGTTTGLSPKQAAETGFTSLLDHDALTATMTLDADPATLDAVFQADTDSPLPQGAAGKLAGASIVIAAKTGGGSFRDLAGSPAAAKNASFALTVNLNQAPDVVQVVSAAQVLYVRVDMNTLLGVLGGDSSSASDLLTNPSVPPALKQILSGHWVKISLADVKSLAGGLVPSVGPSQAAAFAGSLQQIFRNDVTATRVAPDPKLGDHLVLAGNIRTIGTDLLTSVKGLLGSVPGASDLMGSASDSLPDKTVKVDEYVKNGTASAFRFDLTQLLNPAELKAAAGRPAALDVALAPTATITTPTDATPLSTSDLTGLFGLMFGAVGSSSGTFTYGTTTAVPVPVPSQLSLSTPSSAP